MRALFANNRGETYLKEVPDPELGETGVLIETVTSVLGTGSEVGNVSRARRAVQEGSDPGALSERPMSYQSAGRVVEVTLTCTSHYAPGDRVVAVGGGFAPHAERAFLTRHNFAKIPDALDTAEAATANIGLTALHAIRRAQLLPGETAAVIGMGLVGQMIAQMVRMMGGQAIGIDLIPFRLEKARELGIDLALQGDADTLAAAVADYTCGLGVDASFVAAGGGPEPGRLGIRLVRPSGRVMMIGGLVPDFTVAHPDANPHTKRSTYAGCSAAGRAAATKSTCTPAPTTPTASCSGTGAQSLRTAADAGERRRSCRPSPHAPPFADAQADILEHPDEALRWCWSIAWLVKRPRAVDNISTQFVADWLTI